MKKIIFLLFVSISLQSCNKENIDKTLTISELITLNNWQLSRYANPTTGKTITNNELNTEAIAIYSMYYVFGTDQFVTAYDKAGNQFVSKGAWTLYENDTKIKVELVGTTLDFKLVDISKGKMTFQAETGNYLSGVGDAINLEFVEKK